MWKPSAAVFLPRGDVSRGIPAMFPKPPFLPPGPPGDFPGPAGPLKGLLPGLPGPTPEASARQLTVSAFGREVSVLVSMDMVKPLKLPGAVVSAGGDWKVDVAINHILAGAVLPTALLAARVPADQAAAFGWCEELAHDLLEQVSLSASEDSTSLTVKLPGAPALELSMSADEIERNVFAKRWVCLQGDWVKLTGKLGLDCIAQSKRYVQEKAMEATSDAVDAVTGEEKVVQTTCSAVLQEADVVKGHVHSTVRIVKGEGHEEDATVDMGQLDPKWGWVFTAWSPQNRVGAGLLVPSDESKNLLMTDAEVVGHAVVQNAASVLQAALHIAGFVNPALGVALSLLNQAVLVAKAVKYAKQAADAAGETLEANAPAYERYRLFVETSMNLFDVTGVQMAKGFLPDLEEEGMRLEVGRSKLKKRTVEVKLPAPDVYCFKYMGQIAWVFGGQDPSSIDPIDVVTGLPRVNMACVNAEIGVVLKDGAAEIRAKLPAALIAGPMLRETEAMRIPAAEASMSTLSGESFHTKAVELCERLFIKGEAELEELNPNAIADAVAGAISKPVGLGLAKHPPSTLGIKMQ